jgi:hypothetical protein
MRLVMGCFWEEHTLLRIAYTAEQSLERRQPQVSFSILGQDAGTFPDRLYSDVHVKSPPAGR